MILCHAVGAVLFASWLWAPTRALWDALDMSVFLRLNGILRAGRAWQVIFAIGNWRPFDLFTGCLMLGVVSHWLLAERRAHVRERLANFLAFTIVAAAVVYGIEKAEGVIGYRRPSPTKILRDAVRLSHEVTWITVKDTSPYSFPADHAFVLMITILFLWAYAGWRRGAIAAAVFVPFMAPRLVAGAHWLTDVAIGSTVLILVFAGWWFGSPLHSLACRAADAVVRRLPGLAWLESQPHSQQDEDL